MFVGHTVIICHLCMLQVGGLDDSKGSDMEQTQLLAEKMGGVTILCKGQIDVISNGTNSTWLINCY